MLSGTKTMSLGSRARSLSFSPRLVMAETSMDGRALRPHIVKEVRGTARPPLERPDRGRIPGRPEDWRAVKDGLERVVATGTGTAARVPGIRVAGKTGTAQNPHGDDHALFACYAPADRPEIALAFVIENSGHGGSVAAPKAGHVLRTLFLPDSLRAPKPAARTAVHDTTDGAGAAVRDTAGVEGD